MSRLVTAVAAACAFAAGAASSPGSVAKKPPPLSVWVGDYMCSQGITAVRLELDIRASGAVEASFQFGPHPDNPTIERGEVAMRGEVKPLARGRFKLHLVPDHWVSKPSGRWEMVGLTAESDVEHRTLEGRIDDERCGEIKVAREQ